MRGDERKGEERRRGKERRGEESKSVLCSFLTLYILASKGVSVTQATAIITHLPLPTHVIHQQKKILI